MNQGLGACVGVGEPMRRRTATWSPDSWVAREASSEVRPGTVSTPSFCLNIRTRSRRADPCESGARDAEGCAPARESCSSRAETQRAQPADGGRLVTRCGCACESLDEAAGEGHVHRLDVLLRPGLEVEEGYPVADEPAEPERFGAAAPSPSRSGSSPKWLTTSAWSR